MAEVIADQNPKGFLQYIGRESKAASKEMGEHFGNAAWQLLFSGFALKLTLFESYTQATVDLTSGEKAMMSIIYVGFFIGGLTALKEGVQNLTQGMERFSYAKKLREELQLLTFDIKDKVILN